MNGYVLTLQRYRFVFDEAWALREQADRILKVGTPKGMSSREFKEIYIRTNDAAGASLQNYEWFETEITRKLYEIFSMIREFEHVLDLIEDDQKRVICRMYYALLMTDEEIAEQINVDQSTVNRKRKQALLFLQELQ